MKLDNLNVGEIVYSELKHLRVLYGREVNVKLD